MKQISFGKPRQVVFVFSFLFALLTVAQPVITYHNKNVEESKDYIKGNNYQKDFLLFMDMLQNTHPAFVQDAPIDIQKELKQGYARCNKCQSMEDFSYVLQQIAAKLHDGHTGVKNSSDLSLRYPIHFFVDDKGVYLDAVWHELKSSLGKKISKINGKDILYIYDQFKSYVSFSNEVEYRKMFKNSSGFYYLWKETGLCERDSSITISFTDGESLTLKPMQFQDRNLSWVENKSQVQQMRLHAGGMPFSFHILNNKICYLLFDQCEDRNTYRQKYLPQVAGNEMLRMRLEQNLKPVPVFTEFLDSMFQTMKEQNIETLVVDVRENSGGNSILCNELLCRLKSSIVGQRVSVRPSQLAESYYEAMGNDKSELYSTTNEHYIYQGLENPFNGNVIWIQGEQTFSSAGILMTMAVDNNIGIAIGEPASYMPTHYGDFLSWNLPNTQASGYISHKCFVRPDETKGDTISLEKILPTSFEDYQKGIDPCYDWILNNYNK